MALIDLHYRDVDELGFATRYSCLSYTELIASIFLYGIATIRVSAASTDKIFTSKKMFKTFLKPAYILIA